MGTSIYADRDLGKFLATGWVVSFDPGLGHPAIAVWDRGTLVRAARVKLPGALKKLDRVERGRQISALVAAQALGELPAGERFIAFLCEHPQWYSERQGKSKVDPNKLAGMAVIDGAVAARLDVPTWSYLPGEWCSGMPKSETGDPWKSPRGHVIKSRLRPGELEVIEPTHDALDSVGVGMKFLLRLEKNLVGTTR